MPVSGSLRHKGCAGPKCGRPRQPSRKRSYFVSTADGLVRHFSQDLRTRPKAEYLPDRPPSMHNPSGNLISGRLRPTRFSLGNSRWTFFLLLALFSHPLLAQDLTLQNLVTPSTVVVKNGHPVVFAIHGVVEFKSMAEAFPYIESQTQRWKSDPDFDAPARQKLGRELVRRAVESRVISMTDERPLELLLTHT